MTGDWLSIGEGVVITNGAATAWLSLVLLVLLGVAAAEWMLHPGTSDDDGPEIPDLDRW